MKNRATVDISAILAFDAGSEDRTIRIQFCDGRGKCGTATISVAALRMLVQAVPAPERKAVAFIEDGPARARPVDHWRLERGSDSGLVILTVGPCGLGETSFAIREETVVAMADFLSEYRVEAFPDGLRFH